MMEKDMGAIPGSREPDPASGSGPSGFDPARVEWRTQTAKYSFGKDLIVGGIKVGSAFYDGVSSMATADHYKIETRLPGMRPKVDRFATEDEAKIALERVTLAWFARTLPAIATEARRAETPESGSVHEGAGPQDIAQEDAPSSDMGKGE